MFRTLERTKIKGCKSMYDRYYKVWCNQLARVALSRFTWIFKNMSVYESTVLSKEIERRLFFDGQCGIVDNGNEVMNLIAVYCQGGRQNNDYFDLFDTYTTSTPTSANEYTTNDSICVIYNNDLRYPSKDRVLITAETLAHLEVSINWQAVNARESNTLPVASTDKQKAIIKDYRDKIFDGEFVPLIDKGMSMMEVYNTSTQKSGDMLKSLYETKQNVLDDFYNYYGIKTNIEKKGNLIESEINANEEKLNSNVEDMLENRIEGCAFIKDVFGEECEVHINVNE